jgi:hypothetical protein
VPSRLSSELRWVSVLFVELVEYLIAEAAVASVSGPPEDALIVAAARSAYEANGFHVGELPAGLAAGAPAAVHSSDHDGARALLAMVADARPTTFRPTSRHSGRDMRR